MEMVCLPRCYTVYMMTALLTQQIPVESILHLFDGIKLEVSGV